MITLDTLSKTSKKALARSIRALIEPDGATSVKMVSEVQIRKLIKSESTQLDNGKEDFLIVTGMSDIVNILESNYSSVRTINRLKTKIKPVVVWDASIINLPIEKLSELFYRTDCTNLFTSLTVKEISTLATTKVDDTTTENQLESKKKARFILTCIVEDKNSDYCFVVNLNKEKYVDTHLLEFCDANNYSLYTYDRALAVRAKSYGVHAVSFNKVFTYPYTPGNGKNIILDFSALKKRSVGEILATANRIGGGKFIITRDFVEKLEAYKNENTVIAFICFLLCDKNNKYSIYLSPDEYSSNTESLESLALRLDAIILTASTSQCIDYRSTFFNNYQYVHHRTYYEQIEKNSDLFKFYVATNVGNDNVELASQAPVQFECETDISSEDQTNYVDLVSEEQDTTFAENTESSAKNTFAKDNVISTNDESTYSVVEADDPHAVVVSSVPDSLASEAVYYNKKKDTFAGFALVPTNVGPSINQAFVENFNQITNAVDEFYPIPHFSPQKKSISMFKLNLTEKMWVLDEKNMEIPNRGYLPVEPNYSVIHGLNNLNGTYTLKVYTVVSKKNGLFGKLIFSKDYHDFSELSKYTRYAEVTQLMT